MAIAHEDLTNGVRRVILSGRLDFHGVEEIIGELSTLLTSTGKSALIDLTNASLICSMGIRALILNAKNMHQRGMKIALVVEDGSLVSTTLKSVGIDSLMPMYRSLPDAQSALQ